MTRNEFIFKIRALMRAIESSTALDELNLSAREILKLIAEREGAGMSTRSSDVIGLNEFGTAPTVYARLAELEEAGWLSTVQDPEDGRAKLLRLTPRAEKAFTQMSRELGRLSAKGNASA